MSRINFLRSVLKSIETAKKSPKIDFGKLKSIGHGDENIIYLLGNNVIKHSKKGFTERLMKRSVLDTLSANQIERLSPNTLLIGFDKNNGLYFPIYKLPIYNPVSSWDEITDVLLKDGYTYEKGFGNIGYLKSKNKIYGAVDFRPTNVGISNDGSLKLFDVKIYNGPN